MKEERGHSEVSAAADVYLCVCPSVSGSAASVLAAVHRCISPAILKPSSQNSRQNRNVIYIC